MKQEVLNKTISSERSFCLPKSGILKGKINFNRLFTNGKSVHGAHTGIRFLIFEEEAPHQLISFVVKKKTGNAVLRNRLKRLMREVYRHHQYILAPILNHGYSFNGAIFAKSNHDDFKSFNTDCETMLKHIVAAFIEKHSL